MPTGVYKRTEEHKENISKSHIGIISGMYGKKHSIKTKMKMSVAHKGEKPFTMTDEIKSKMSLAKKGKIGNNKGKRWKIKDTSKMKGRKLTEETREKIGNATRGEKSYRWIKDRTKLKTSRKKDYDTKYKYWMLEVKKRDKWVCRIADVNCDGRLEAHHILNWKDYPELRYEINNGITLCHAHHPRGRENEVKLTPYLQSLVVKV